MQTSNCKFFYQAPGAMIIVSFMVALTKAMDGRISRAGLVLRVDNN